MGLQLLLCALRRVGVVAMALLGGMSMTPVSAQYREQRITTVQGTYVLRSDADDDERMEGWSSSLMVHRLAATSTRIASMRVGLPFPRANGSDVRWGRCGHLNAGDPTLSG